MRKSELQAFVADFLDLRGYASHMFGWPKRGRLTILITKDRDVTVHLPASSAMKRDEVERRLEAALAGTSVPTTTPAWVPPAGPQMDLETHIGQAA